MRSSSIFQFGFTAARFESRMQDIRGRMQHYEDSVKSLEQPESLDNLRQYLHKLQDQLNAISNIEEANRTPEDNRQRRQLKIDIAAVERALQRLSDKHQKALAHHQRQLEKYRKRFERLKLRRRQSKIDDQK